MITNHTTLLQALIDKYNLKSYLEIGVQDPNNNFHKIKCFEKTGVDPQMINARVCSLFFRETSDNFFIHNINYFDLIFIDGLHTAEQVKKDFENSLKCLTDNGYIVIHDCLPVKEETTLIPRQTRCWHGTVYKFAMMVRNYLNLRFITFNIDEGCMLIWKGETESNFDASIYYNTDWITYKSVGHVLMNVVDEVII
jgi:hypothetical protein